MTDVIDVAESNTTTTAAIEQRAVRAQFEKSLTQGTKRAGGDEEPVTRDRRSGLQMHMHQSLSSVH